MKTTSLLLLLPVTLGLALGPSACKKSQDTANPAQTSGSLDGADDGSKDPDKGNVAIDEEIATMCSLPETNFAFDSTKLSASAKSTLDALAACFIDGPAKDKRMALVGHADPRGDEEYNLGLGQRRAGSVVKYLGNKGLANDRMESSSRGELDAVGTDEAGWSKDRRVDILLAR